MFRFVLPTREAGESRETLEQLRGLPGVAPVCLACAAVVRISGLSSFDAYRYGKENQSYGGHIYFLRSASCLRACRLREMTTAA